MQRSLVTRLVALGVAGLGALSCANALDAGADDPQGDPETFIPPEAAPPNDPNALRRLCASSTCPSPFGTCPGDRFNCETNFDSDSDNCGECGVTCPRGDLTRAIFGAEWFCQAGHCQMACDADSRKGDCNGDVVDGCETSLKCDANNCGACGIACQAGTTCVDGQCGCAAGLTVCGQACQGARCVDLVNDDLNCGSCGRSCPPFPEGDTTLPPNTKLGCAESSCGRLKCSERRFRDCNDIIDDGCEVDVDEDAANCGACGTVCAPGQTCIFGACGCAPNETRCGEAPIVTCTDLDTDPMNCGACGYACPGVWVPDAGEAVCRLAHCELACPQGRADCDGRFENGCETLITTDPSNCGGCGSTCDRNLGQPCVNGACNRVPCDEEPSR